MFPPTTGLFLDEMKPDGDTLGEALLKDIVRAPRQLNKSNKGMNMAAGLTCLQFAFAIYATFLLYVMSPNMELMTDSDSSWATQIAKLLSKERVHPMNLKDGRELLVELTKSTVCQREEIDFAQKKSNNTKLVDLKRSLFK